MARALIQLTVLSLLVATGCSGAGSGDPQQFAEPAVRLPPAIHGQVACEAGGGRRSQVRAVISKEVHTQAEIEGFASTLARSQGFDHALVTFFDDTACLRNWDGKGSLVDHEWPHCLCRVLVDDEQTVFQLAFDESTSRDRTDVLLQQTATVDR